MTLLRWPPFTDADDWDESLEKTEDAQRVVAVEWAGLDQELEDWATRTVLTLSTVVGWHKTLFEGIFP